MRATPHSTSAETADAGVDQRARTLMDAFDSIFHEILRQERRAIDGSQELNRQEFSVLGVIGRRGHCMMSDISADLGLALSSVTGLVDRLVEKGVAARQRSQEDRRVIQVELSPAGQRLGDSLQQARRRVIQKLLTCLEPAEQETLVALHAKISASLARPHSTRSHPPKRH